MENQQSKGFIKLDRRMLEWEWYQNQNTKDLFIHCLLKANHKDRKWQGIDIKRGEFLTGRKALSEELKMTEQQIRTALNKLQSTNEITIKSTSRYSILKVNNYNLYQDNNQQITNNQPTDNQQITTTKELKKEKKEKNIEKINKKEYGLYKNILLTDEEYKKIVDLYITPENLDKAIEKLSVWKYNKKKKETHNYGTFLKTQWVYRDVMGNSGSKFNGKEEASW